MKSSEKFLIDLIVPLAVVITYQDTKYMVLNISNVVDDILNALITSTPFFAILITTATSIRL